MARKIKRHRNSQMVEQLRHARAVAGMERAEFFKNNGDPKQWRPVRKIAVNKRKRANKNACRGRVDR